MSHSSSTTPVVANDDAGGAEAAVDADALPVRKVEPEAANTAMPFRKIFKTSSAVGAPFQPTSTATAQIAPAQVLNATAPVEEFLAATLSIRTAFAQARAAARHDDELFDLFAARLEELLRRFGSPAYDITGRIILIEGVEPKLGLNALRAASHVSDATTTETRKRLALDALTSAVPQLRYGALHMLADIGDLSALDDLQRAAASEKISALRADIQRLIELLRQQG